MQSDTDGRRESDFLDGRSCQRWLPKIVQSPEPGITRFPRIDEHPLIAHQHSGSSRTSLLIPFLASFEANRIRRSRQSRDGKTGQGIRGRLGHY